jgi:enoyl-CoA hydratase/carnithine racemase
MTYNTINWRIVNDTGHLVLDQPPANTMTRKFFVELGRLTRDVIPGSGIRALVIYGQGRHFSSGADHTDLVDHIGEGLPGNYPHKLPGFLVENMESFRYLANLSVPTFAAIRGTCLGSGLELALCCNYRICGDGAVLGFPESSFGLMPGCGGSVKLPGIVGRSKAMELILSGRNFSAEEAHRWGIVQRVVPRKEAVEVAVRLAERMISDF